MENVIISRIRNFHRVIRSIEPRRPGPNEIITKFRESPICPQGRWVEDIRNESIYPRKWDDADKDQSPTKNGDR